MPTNIKIVASVLVVLVALITSYFEHQAGASTIKWFVIGLGLFMAVSLWVFPEPKKDRPKKGS